MSEPNTVVLIVDDEEMIRDSLAAFLETEGFSVVTAGSLGEAGKLLAGDGRVDVAVVDIRLPDGDGRDFIAGSKALRPGVRHLIYTGSLDFSLTPELLEAGLTLEDVFQKPMLDLTQLSAAIRRLRGRTA